jgi:hypothetical protein
VRRRTVGSRDQIDFSPAPLERRRKAVGPPSVSALSQLGIRVAALARVRETRVLANAATLLLRCDDALARVADVAQCAISSANGLSLRFEAEESLFDLALPASYLLLLKFLTGIRHIQVAEPLLGS